MATRIEILFSAYRKADFADPVGFVAQLGVVLEKYPEWVVRHVTSPETGIQRKSTFPPSIAEVISACEDLYGAERYAEEWDARAKRQAEERERLPEWVRPRQAPTISYAEAELMRKGNGSIRILGPFDLGRAVPYRG